MNRAAFIERLKRFEGLELQTYRCPRGILTIGFGHTGPDVKPGMVISERQAADLLAQDAASVVAQCREHFPWFNALCDLRQMVIADMCFNMGLVRLKGFRKMLSAVEAQDFERAANEILMSSYAGQVGKRAAENAQLMLLGDTIH